MCCYGWDFLVACHHSAKVGGHRHCGSEDITLFIYHMIMEGHMIEVSCNIMHRSSSFYVTTQPILVTIDILDVEIFLICHVILQDHATLKDHAILCVGALQGKSPPYQVW